MPVIDTKAVRPALRLFYDALNLKIQYQPGAHAVDVEITLTDAIGDTTTLAPPDHRVGPASLVCSVPRQEPEQICDVPFGSDGGSKWDRVAQLVRRNVKESVFACRGTRNLRCAVPVDAYALGRAFAGPEQAYRSIICIWASVWWPP